MTVIRPRWILGLGWIAFLVYAFPGQLTQDSLDQLAEARSDEWTDAHPPIMTLTWRIVDELIAGPFGMLVLQSGLFLAGVALLFERVMPATRAAWCAIGVLLFPPVMAPLAAIWKDAMMAGLCMLGTALLFGDSRRAQRVGLALLGLGAAFRYNGCFLTLPIIVVLFEWRPGMRPLARYATAAATWFAITLAGFGVNALLTDRTTHLWHSSVGVMDIAGTLCYEPAHFTDEELRELLAGTEFRIHDDIEARMCRLVGSGTFARLTLGDHPMWNLSLVEAAPPAQRDAIERAWRASVVGHPIAYLKYRMIVFARVLGIYGEVWGSVTPRSRRTHEWSIDQHKPLGLSTGYSSLQSGWTRVLAWLAEHTPLFKPWLYVLLAIATLVYSRRRQRHRRLVLALVLSGIAIELSLFFLAGSPDFRYSHWLVVCACVAALVASAASPRAAAPPT